MATIIDLNAEAAKLTTLHEATPQAAPARPKGGMVHLGSYRGGIVLLGASMGSGRGHWETHPEDELIHILDGTRTLEIVCDDGPPKSFELRAGMIAVVPQEAWHRFHSVGFAMVLSAVIPGPHVELDVPDPRPHARTSSEESRFAGRSPSIIDLRRELATAADREGSVAELAPYRDGILLLSKGAGGKAHWETHPADELVHVLDGTVILDIVEDDRPQSYTLGTGTMVIVPQGAWHRLHSADDHTAMSATVPGEHIDLDVDDPRQVERRPA